MFDNPKLIEKFGSWIEVQVAFYDFIFMEASEMCPECFRKQAIENVMDGKFADGEDIYEQSIKAIEKTWESFDLAWQAFKEDVNGKIQEI